MTSAGGVKCWGANGSGQVGDGSTTQRLAPVDVSGLSAGATAITAGGDHSCAVVSGSEAKCWGRNVQGELGDSATTGQLAPDGVTGLQPTTPSVPTMVSVFRDVQFSPPADDGGTPITGYHLSVVSADGAEVFSATVLSSPYDFSPCAHLVRGLYEFRLSAINVLGEGVPATVAFDAGECNVGVDASLPSVGIASSNGDGSLNFGVQLVNTSSAPQIAVVKNTSNCSLSILVSSTTSNYLTSDNCSSTLYVGDSCALNIFFSPTVVGDQQYGKANIDWTKIDCSGVVGTIVVNLSGIGVSVPGAPTGVVASAGSGQASIVFAPPYDGGSPITSYTVTSSPGNYSASGTSWPITVRGLTNGTTYTFTVRATNVYGTGPASDPSNAVTPGDASSTTIVSNLNPSTVGDTVTFTATVSGSSGTPTGTVAFRYGGVVLTTAPLLGGVSAYTTNTLV